MAAVVALLGTFDPAVAALEVALGVAPVAGNGVVVVARLVEVRLDDAVAAPLHPAVVAAGPRPVDDPQIALLARLLDAVAAELALALLRAPVVGDGVAVVTLLGRIEDAVSALDG